MSYDVEKMMAHMEELKKNKECLMSWVSNEIASGCQQFDLKSAGETIDMIKDLADAEKNCWEAMYYKTVVEAMQDRDDDMMGYNNRRMANGQYAPAGRGHMGYKPWVDQEPYIDAYLHNPEFRDDMMGYSSSNNRGNSSNSSSRRSGGNDSYAGYQNAKMAYHSSGSSSDKERMDNKRMEYVREVVDHLSEMWADADPMLKRRMKEDLKEFMED